MDDVTTETDATTASTTTTTEKFDLVKKYLHDWPPAFGHDVSDAATYGLAFIVVIGLLLTCCIVIDIDFFRRKMKLLRQKKHEKELEKLLRVQSSAGQRRAVSERLRLHRADVTTPRHSGRRSPRIVPYHVNDAPPPPAPPPYSKINRSMFQAV